MKSKETISKNDMRINSIDIMRLISAFFVMLMHLDIYYAGYFRWFARFAVPFFFITSGYFFANSDDDKRKIQIKKIFRMSIYVNIFYFVEQVIKKIMLNETFEIVDFFSLKKLILFNYFPFAEEMWYFLALFYCLLISYFIFRGEDKNNSKNKYILCISIILLIANLTLGTYSKIILKQKFEPEIIRNFLFTGLPFFWLGYLIKGKENIIENLENYKLIIGIIAVIITSYLELKIISTFGSYTYENCISQFILAILIFIFCIRNKFNYENKIIKKMSDIGRKYSLYIYIFHPIINGVFSVIIKKLNLSYLIKIYRVCSPIIVFVVAIFISMIYLTIKSIICNKILCKKKREGI